MASSGERVDCNQLNAILLTISKSVGEAMVAHSRATVWFGHSGLLNVGATQSTPWKKTHSLLRAHSKLKETQRLSISGHTIIKTKLY